MVDNEEEKIDLSNKTIDFTLVYPWYDEKLMGEILTYEDLFRDIVDAGLCCTNGACVASCPTFVLEFDGQTPIIVDPDGCVECSLCVRACPVYIHLSIKDRVIEEDSLGPVISLWEAYSADSEIRENGQSGGVATALLLCALEEGLVEASLVLEAEGDLTSSKPKIAYNREELMRAQGSKYIAYPSVESIFQIKRNNIERFAYVGIPCQISGLERLAHERVDALAQKAAYKIGLFCMESFQPKPFKDIIMEKKGIDISKATKINTEKGRLYAWMPGEEKPITVKIKHFDEAMLPGCNVCVDFTAEEADISIGNLGAKDRNSVVIVRNEKGEKLFNLAVEKGYLIAESMNEKALEKIKALNRRKKIERARPQLFDELEPL